MQLTALTIRLACNQSSRDTINDKRTGKALSIWRGNSAVLQGCVFTANPAEATFVSDVGNISSFSLVIRDGSATGTVLYEATTTDINGAATYSAWLADTAQHFEFPLTDTDTNLPAGKIWYAIAASTTDSGTITVCTGIGEIKEDGLGNPGTPETPDYTSWSKVEADARYGRLLSMDLPSGSRTGTFDLSGLSLADAPTKITLTVSMPTAAGDVLIAVPVQDSITSAGFDFELSAAPSVSGHKLFAAFTL